MSLIDFSKFQKTETESSIPAKIPKKLKGLSVMKDFPDPEKLTSKDVLQSIFMRFYNHRYMINNAYVFDWESDFFSVTESDYIYEIEIKISKSDFRDDFNKQQKHNLLESFDQNTFNLKPNKFFYAVPKGLLHISEIPEYAGLIEVISPTIEAEIVKDAPFLHTDKILDHYKDKLLNKFSWRYRDEMLKKYQKDLEDLENTQ